MTTRAEVATLKALLTQLPLTEEQRQQAEELVKKCTLEELQELGLTTPARPVVPKGLDKLAPTLRLQAVQRVISSLHYNHAPGYMYNVAKDRPHCAIMNTARDVLRDALPIKCIEATFLGMLLTSNWPELERLPVGFKSKCAGQAYRHIVLAVHHVPTGQWGALGISRRADLQFKELGTAASLADLMYNYKTCYAGWGHQLYKVRVGLPAEHDPSHTGPVCWRYCNVSCGRHPWERCQLVLDTFAENTRVLANRFKVLGFHPPSRGGNDIYNPMGNRVALSGTTPEPGAVRLPPVSTLGPTRHASVSPMRRRGALRPEDASKGVAHFPMALQRSPSKARAGCTSAPPQQRPDPSAGSAGSVLSPQPAATNGRTLLPSSTLPAHSGSKPPLGPSGRNFPSGKHLAKPAQEHAQAAAACQTDAPPAPAPPAEELVGGPAVGSGSGAALAASQSNKDEGHSGDCAPDDGSVSAQSADNQGDLLRASLTVDAQHLVEAASSHERGQGPQVKEAASSDSDADSDVNEDDSVAWSLNKV